MSGEPLDPYHRFVVDKFAEIYEEHATAVVEAWIRCWVSEHPDQVRDVGATVEDWAGSA